jgi:DNA-binding NarL/FixJ family response regulator
MARWRNARGARVETPLIRVAIVDDHPVVRDGTAALLASQEGIEVVGTAGTLDAAIELLARTEVDVVLLDIRLGADSGLRLFEASREGPPPHRPLPAVVVLSAYDYPQYAEAALRLGAAGFVIKTAPVQDLLDAVRRAAAGGMAFQVRPNAGSRGSHLSRRELDVVRLVVEGRSNDEIAVRLSIGVKTVETHLRRLFERFEVGSRTELAARALREGWLEIPPG